MVAAQLQLQVGAAHGGRRMQPQQQQTTTMMMRMTWATMATMTLAATMMAWVMMTTMVATSDDRPSNALIRYLHEFTMQFEMHASCCERAVARNAKWGGVTRHS